MNTGIFMSLLTLTLVSLYGCFPDHRWQAEHDGPGASVTTGVAPSSYAAVNTGVLPGTLSDLEEDEQPQVNHCVEDALNDLNLDYAGGRLRVSGRLSLAHCWQAGGAAGPRPETMQRFVDFSIACDGVDLSIWDGKTYGDIVRHGTPVCGQSQAAQVTSQDVNTITFLHHGQPADFPGVASVPAETVSDSRQGFRAVTSSFGADGGPCRFVEQGGYLVRQNCVQISRESMLEEPL